MTPAKCPNCGAEFSAHPTVGRKPLNIELSKVTERIQAHRSASSHRSVVAAALDLGCSPSFIYGLLRQHGLKAKEVIG
jgi:hypothetical protein